MLGLNNHGQLGYGDTIIRGIFENQMNDYLPFVDVGSGVTPLQIRNGEAYTCIITTIGTVRCWGQNDFGELGLGHVTNKMNSSGDMIVETPLGTGLTTLDICTTQHKTCALFNSYDMKCWGANFNGQLGYGDTNNRGDDPGEMGDSLPFINLGFEQKSQLVFCGYYFTCALLLNGDFKCWGEGDYGALGQGDTLDRGEAVGQMGDYLPPISLGLGLEVVSCSELSPTVSPTPYFYPDLGCKKSDFGGEDFAIVLLKSGNVKSFGDNFLGQLGYEDTMNRGDDPNELGDYLPFINLGSGFINPIISVAAGKNHACVVSSSLSVKCWGLNASGQLGYGDIMTRGESPNSMGNYLPFINLGSNFNSLHVFTGDNTTFALSENGELKSWGMNDNGQLGLNDIFFRGDDPNEMGDYLNIINIGTGLTAREGSSGNTHSCVINQMSDLKCFGANWAVF